VFNATFNNILAISWRPVLVVEEAGENHRPWASNWKTLSLAVVSRVHPFCNLQSRSQPHAVLVCMSLWVVRSSHPGPLNPIKNMIDHLELKSLKTWLLRRLKALNDQLNELSQGHMRRLKVINDKLSTG